MPVKIDLETIDAILSRIEELEYKVGKLYDPEDTAGLDRGNWTLEKKSLLTATQVVLIDYLLDAPMGQTSHQDIANRMEREVKTIRTHFNNIYKTLRRLGYPIYSKQQLTTWALKSIRVLR